MDIVSPLVLKMIICLTITFSGLRAKSDENWRENCLGQKSKCIILSPSCETSPLPLATAVSTAVRHAPPCRRRHHLRPPRSPLQTTWSPPRSSSQTTSLSHFILVGRAFFLSVSIFFCICFGVRNQNCIYKSKSRVAHQLRSNFLCYLWMKNMMLLVIIQISRNIGVPTDFIEDVDHSCV